MTLHSAKFHLLATIAWGTAGAGVTWWATVRYDEPPWVAVMSLYAIIVGHWGAYQGARAEEKARDVQGKSPNSAADTSTKERLMGKSIFLSKTFWVNVAAVLAMILDDQEALNIIPDVIEPHMVKILAVINVILRYWTRQPVEVRLPAKTAAGTMN